MLSQKFVAAADKIINESEFMKKSEREAEHLLEAIKESLNSIMPPRKQADLVADRIQDQEPDLFSLVSVLDLINDENPWHTTNALKLIGTALLRSREPKAYDLVFEEEN